MIYEAKHHNGKHWWGGSETIYISGAPRSGDRVSPCSSEVFFFANCLTISILEKIQTLTYTASAFSQAKSIFKMCVLRISWGKSWINLNTSFHTLSLGFLTWEILSVWFSFVIPILRLAITKDYICVICKAFEIFKWWVFFDINRFHLIGFLWTLQQEKRRGCSYWGSAVSGGWHLWKHFWNLSS